MHKEKLAHTMEFPPAIEQPNVYPLSWQQHTKKLEDIWDASRRDFAATHPAPADRLAELRKIGVVSSVVSANARQQRFLAATQAL